MKIKDFEKCIDIIGLNMEVEIKNVSLSSATGHEVKRAMVIHKFGENVNIYYWDDFGNCVMQIFKTNDEDTIEKIVEVLWMFPQLLSNSTRVSHFDMPELERKYFAK